MLHHTLLAQLGRGDKPQMADELLTLVAAGKTATYHP